MTGQAGCGLEVQNPLQGIDSAQLGLFVVDLKVFIK